MEELYQYLWQHRMLGRSVCLADGTSVEILNPGRRNTDAGPDFFNAHVRIGDEDWVGNVEIHVKASDWYRHGHDKDKAYDSVVLHAVAVSDAEVRRADGGVIPQVTLAMPEGFYRMYSQLAQGIPGVRCSGSLKELPALAVTDWLETLSVERMQKKAQRVVSILESTGGDWEQTCFIMLCRSLGFNLNGEPFERLGRITPLKILHHHSDNLMQLEALLFGQAGMLDTSVHIFDEYYQEICHEYFFLARKYGLRPMPSGNWKYARTRPQNFPHRRIAMLARACHGGFRMLGNVLACRGDSDMLRQLFRWRLDGYWRGHADFDVPGTSAGGQALSAASVNLLLINMVSPLYYAYGSVMNDPDLAESGLRLLEDLPAESNAIIRQWSMDGMKADCALRSQALLQLRREYCDPGKCFSCRFSHRLLCREARDQEKP